MAGPMLQHGFTSGRQVSLIIAVAFGLALSTQVAGARECHRETPLPACEPNWGIMSSPSRCRQA